jgi:hypothetical protein
MTKYYDASIAGSARHLDRLVAARIIDHDDRIDEGGHGPEHTRDARRFVARGDHDDDLGAQEHAPPYHDVHLSATARRRV